MPTINISKRGHYDFEKLEPQIRSVYTTKPEISSIKYSTKSVLLPFVEKQIIGRDRIFQTPFGQRKVVYCDYTASAKSLQCFEEFISVNVLPDYANTHTKATMSAQQTSAYRTEARNIIRKCTNSGSQDSVLFCGSGCTAAITKLIGVMGLDKLKKKPIIFTGPYEHHSNILPWRELGQCVRISQNTSGHVDLVHLVKELKKYKKSGRCLLGCFSAGSNVTGIITDADPITKLLHDNGALACWDYAACAPYVDIRVNHNTNMEPSVYDKDAVFLSIHKFVGGVETPGLLIAKNTLFKANVPAVVGGGTVLFVRREGHRYLKNIEDREDAGTPQIVGAIRAGLVFQLKADITSDVIMHRDRLFVKRAYNRWNEFPEYLHILGSSSSDRLPIFSFLVRHPDSGLLLHHDFVCTLLNDLFGIQARSGCACAGPYAEDLMGIDEKQAKVFSSILDDCQNNKIQQTIYKPGFTRLNIAYFMDDRTVDFIIEAVALVARYAWRLLPQYDYDASTGEWRHRDNSTLTPATSRPRNLLRCIDYRNTGCRNLVTCGQLPGGHRVCLDSGIKAFKEAAKTIHFPCDIHVEANLEKVRWFLTPKEANLFLKRLEIPETIIPSRREMPFHPVCYPESMKTVTYRYLE